MCRILSLITMLAVLFLAKASAQYSYDAHTLCSDRLNDMLMMVCEKFNGVTTQKRGMSMKILRSLVYLRSLYQKLLVSISITVASDLDPLDPIQYVENTEGHPLFRGRFNGGGGVLNSVAPIRRLTREGIVDRCCRQPCHIDILKEYCLVSRF